MANRAYLYSSDYIDPWPKPYHAHYYDSRHVIPLAWFFFYLPSHVFMAEVRFNGKRWTEPKLAAEKAAAVALFMARQRLLLEVIGHRLNAAEIERFADTVGGRPGRFLLVDPLEVLQQDPGDDAGHLIRILSSITVEDAESQALLETVQTHVGAFRPDPEEFLGQVIGYTYWE